MAAETLLEWGATYLLHSTLLLAGVWLATRLLPLGEGTREVLWKAALLGGLLSAGARGAGWDAALPLERAALEIPAPAAVVPRSALPSPPAGGSPAPSPALPVGTLALGIWLAGAALASLRLAVGHLRLRSLLRGRVPVTDPALRAELERLCEAAGVRRPVRLTTTPLVGTPVALGMGEVCVPPRAVAELTPEEWNGLLAHEVAHLRRRDPLWLVAAALVEGVFWFQPLNRVARLRLREAAEVLCDGWAARQAGALAVARCIATVAGWSVVRPPLALAGLAHPGPLTRRVERLLGGAPPPAGAGAARRLALSLAVLGAAVAFAPGVWLATVRQTLLPPAVVSSFRPGPDLPAGPAAGEVLTYGSGPDDVRVREWKQGPMWQLAGGVSGRVRFESKGRIEFGARGDAVRSITPGGYFVVLDEGEGWSERLEVRADEAGRLTYRFTADGEERPWREALRRRWLGHLVRELVRLAWVESASPRPGG